MKGQFMFVITGWLDDIGLPQYKDTFYDARVDGRVLHHLTVVRVGCVRSQARGTRMFCVFTSLVLVVIIIIMIIIIIIIIIIALKGAM